jgi:hypothetical protein
MLNLFLGNSKGGSKKSTGSSKISGGANATEIPGSGKEKYEGSGGVSSKSGGKIHQKGKSQKEKELQWLEKELNKIEREKQRLEREREKYLEREARCVICDSFLTLVFDFLYMSRPHDAVIYGGICPPTICKYSQWMFEYVQPTKDGSEFWGMGVRLAPLHCKMVLRHIANEIRKRR